MNLKPTTLVCQYSWPHQPSKSLNTLSPTLLFLSLSTLSNSLYLLVDCPHNTLNYYSTTTTTSTNSTITITTTCSATLAPKPTDLSILPSHLHISISNLQSIMITISKIHLKNDTMN